jgi:hypothetical protein
MMRERCGHLTSPGVVLAHEQTNSTSGSGFSTLPSDWATAHSRSRANRSMITGKKFGPTVGRSPIFSNDSFTHRARLLHASGDGLAREHAAELL